MNRRTWMPNRVRENRQTAIEAVEPEPDAAPDGIRQHRARVVVVDLTGVPTVDATVASRLVQTGEAARLLGAQFLVSGISREVAQAFTELGTALTGIRTVGDLQGAIEEAELILGEIAA